MKIFNNIVFNIIVIYNITIFSLQKITIHIASLVYEVTYAHTVKRKRERKREEVRKKKKSRS